MIDLDKLDDEQRTTVCAMIRERDALRERVEALNIANRDLQSRLDELRRILNPQPGPRIFADGIGLPGLAERMPRSSIVPLGEMALHHQWRRGAVEDFPGIGAREVEANHDPQSPAA